MNIRKYLPSKQFSIFIGIALLTGIVIFIVLKIIDNKTSLSQRVQNIATREVFEDMDSDNDGLKDWEEALWGLDPNNPDTNGDGILDGQEVEKRKGELRASDQFVEVLAEPKTETEKFARQILTIALNVNQSSGGNLTESQVMAIAENLLKSTNSKGVQVYSVSDLNISTTKTPKSYYDEMSQALAYLNTVPTNELVILEHAISTNRKSFLDDLGPIIEAYASAPEKIIKKEVPAGIADAHVEYLNALISKAVSLVSIAQYFDDPIIAMRGVEEYRLADEKLTESGIKIQRYLRNNGIIIK